MRQRRVVDEGHEGDSDGYEETFEDAEGEHADEGDHAH